MLTPRYRRILLAAASSSRRIPYSTCSGSIVGWSSAQPYSSAADIAALWRGVRSHLVCSGSAGLVPLSNSTIGRTSDRSTSRRRRLVTARPEFSESIPNSKCSVPIRSYPERRASSRALISTLLVRSEAKAHSGRRSGCLQSPETKVPMRLLNRPSVAFKIHHPFLPAALGKIVAREPSL